MARTRTATVTPSDGVNGSSSRPERSFASRLCSGDLKCWQNLLCFPFVALFQSINIYVLPCISIYLRSLCCYVFCSARFCQYFFVFSDKKFKADRSSVGNWKEDGGPEVKWERARAYYRKRLTEEEEKAGVRIKLFEKGIEPKDVAQGQVGNCWLIAALACVAEHPGLVRKAFVTKVASTRGKYVTRLFDWQKNRWVKITVDEKIPLDASNDTMLFAQPNGHELWVSVIEKAFAKFCGSYANLDGGQTAWAFNALTGDPVFKLKRDGENEDGNATWKRLDMEIDDSDTANKRAVKFYGTQEEHTNSSTFFILRQYAKNSALIGASFGAYKPEEKGEGLNGESMGPQGLVAGHAYSVLDCMAFSDRSQKGGRLKLIQLRNPWGKFEWTGPWSDGDAEWDKHPKVKRVIRPSKADDGSFWMSWDDFSRIFSSVDICARSTGLRDLNLDAMEADGRLKNCLGPLVGCCHGCCCFWLGCKGCQALYFDVKSEARTAVVDHEKARDDDLLGSLISGVTDLASGAVTGLFGGGGDDDEEKPKLPPTDGGERTIEAGDIAAAGSAPPPSSTPAGEAATLAPASAQATPAAEQAAPPAAVEKKASPPKALPTVPEAAPPLRSLVAKPAGVRLPPISAGLPTSGSGRPLPEPFI